MAVAIELMAEVASLACPELEVVAVRGLQVLQGVTLEKGPRAIRIVATPRLVSANGGRQVEVTIGGVGEDQRLHYRAVAEMAPSLPSSGTVRIPSFTAGGAFPLTIEEANHHWLFQGPLFLGVTAIQGVGSDGIIGSIAPSSPREFLSNTNGGEWLIDPVIIDSGLQLVILWTRMHRDKTPLPSGFLRYQRFGPPSASPIHCQVRLRPGGDGQIMNWDLFFIGADGNLLGVMEDLETASSKSLNRMSEGPR